MAQRIDLLNNGYKILQDDKAFCFGIDAVLLANFCDVRKNQTVCDLGTGNGILPLLICGKTKSKYNCEIENSKIKITGLEIQSQAADMAKKGVELNGLENVVNILEGDIKNVKKILSAQSANVVVSNPPYMTVEQSHENSTDEKSIARHEVLCNLEDIIKAASFLLKSNGAFYMIHRPYRLQEIFSNLEKYHLTPRRMQVVYPKINQTPEMVLIEARPNYKPDLKITPPLIMYNQDGEYTEEMKSILKSL